MAGFFDKAMDVAKSAATVTGDVAKKAAERTQDTIEVSKINAKIKEEKEKVGKIQSEIGLYFLDKYNAGELTDAFVATKAQEIEKISEQIEIYESKVSTIKEK
ncbi:MAG: hypothetical protein PHW03_06725 [Eubacteriales bacterium]|nr:hypothetical protein [Eubacteriales bacterium]MDD4390480.1 hypothetical protein [Eubacteriales bacterium]